MNVLEARYSLLDLIEYYRSDFAAGGEYWNLHIVLSDGNLTDVDIHNCWEFAKDNNDYLGMFIAEQLRGLNMDEREELYKNLL